MINIDHCDLERWKWFFFDQRHRNSNNWSFKFVFEFLYYFSKLGLTSFQCSLLYLPPLFNETIAFGALLGAWVPVENLHFNQLSTISVPVNCESFHANHLAKQMSGEASIMCHICFLAVQVKMSLWFMFLKLTVLLLLFTFPIQHATILWMRKRLAWMNVETDNCLLGGIKRLRFIVFNWPMNSPACCWPPQKAADRAVVVSVVLISC